ncbi:DUF2865 domain-containing protein [Aurantimonas sp. Leaf443]|uniref:DUF2865 domain-containing protein n=1 Tax=Aurantimonas sp. Leaf443 TaxID=1736378 RepID=UPI0006F5C090|nr:DUF2865 domain-containing protein [Aurantimonas sp. Leaf443]KQT87924.1 hypothetical protein ASG48_00180 [Aurantimonas sp. Leaf443]
MTKTPEPSRLRAVVLLAVCTLAGVPDAGAAGRDAVCTVSARSGGPDAGALQRQLQALRAVRRAQGCASSSALGGFFNGCRDLDGRVAALESRLASLAPSGCTPAREPRRLRRPQEAKPRAPEKARQEAPGEHASSRTPVATMCVRLSDGHFFPSPNSGYNAAADEPKILAQCRLICDTPDMAVYEVVGEERASEEMVSLRDGSRYGALAGLRRSAGASAAGRCDTSRYYRRIVEVEAQKSAELARREAERLGFRGPVPIPTLRPAETAEAAAGEGGAQAGPVRVRIVGAAYFPEDAEREFAGGLLERIAHPLPVPTDAAAAAPARP